MGAQDFKTQCVTRMDESSVAMWIRLSTEHTLNAAVFTHGCQEKWNCEMNTNELNLCIYLHPKNYNYYSYMHNLSIKKASYFEEVGFWHELFSFY